MSHKAVSSQNTWKRGGIPECERPHEPSIGCSSECKFSFDWVRGNIPLFSEILEEFACSDHDRGGEDEGEGSGGDSGKGGIDVLEIGSFEGRSAIYFMSSFNVRTMTCADTWRGGEEMAVISELSAKLDGLEEVRVRVQGPGFGRQIVARWRG